MLFIGLQNYNSYNNKYTINYIKNNNILYNNNDSYFFTQRFILMHLNQIKSSPLYI